MNFDIFSSLLHVFDLGDKNEYADDDFEQHYPETDDSLGYGIINDTNPVKSKPIKRNGDLIMRFDYK